MLIKASTYTLEIIKGYILCSYLQCIEEDVLLSLLRSGLPVVWGIDSESEQTDRQIDRRTDGQTHTQSYIDTIEKPQFCCIDSSTA